MASEVLQTVSCRTGLIHVRGRRCVKDGFKCRFEDLKLPFRSHRASAPIHTTCGRICACAVFRPTNKHLQ